MKRKLLFGMSAALLAILLRAADASPKDDITGAARKLSETPNYSWRTTVVVPENSRFHPGPTEGKTEKDGFTSLSLNFGDNETKAVLKDGKAVASNPDGGWQSLSELDSAQGPARGLGRTLRSFETPAVQAARIASYVKDFKKDGDVYSGEMTEEGAKALLAFRRRSGGEASVSNAKGSASFWLKDGALAKYEFKVKGTVSVNGNEFDTDRTTTVVIKEVGATKVEVPEEAKKKLS